jgi:hypothetical protein
LRVRGETVGGAAPGSPYGTISDVPTLRIAQDDAADELLGRDPLALLIGMLLDQHVRQRSSRAGAIVFR